MKTKLNWKKLEPFIVDSINIIIQKIETKIDQVEENKSIKIEHRKGN